MSTIIHIADEEAQNPYLNAGDYGTGLDNEADVQLMRFEFPATERPCPWDKEGRNAFFGFTVVTADGNKHFVDHWVKPSALKKTLLALGVELSPDPQGAGFSFPENFAPMPVVGLRMGDAREYNGEMRTGRVRQILGR